MRRYALVALGAILGIVLLGALYALPNLTGVAAQTTTGAATTGVVRTITVVGEGTVSAEPDQAVVTIGVENIGDTVQEATGEAGDIMAAMLKALQSLGVKAADIRTSGYSVWTDYSSSSDSSGASAPSYRVNNTVTVTVRDLDNLSAILDAAIGAGANSIQGITFTVEDQDTLASQARAAAVADAASRADELAQLLDLRVGSVVSVSEVVGNSTYPVLKEAAMGIGGGGVGPISVGSLEYSMQIQVVYAIQ